MRRTIFLSLLLLSSCIFLPDSNLSTPVELLTPSIEPFTTQQVSNTPTPNVIQTILPGSTQLPTIVQIYEPEKWAVYTMGSDEFPLMMVHDITSGPDGIIWVASSQGLTRFDGVTWITFTEEDGLISNEAFAVAVEKGGAVWVGTKNGVSKYDGNTWQSYTAEDGLSGKYIRYISIDNDGKIWFVTQGYRDNKVLDGVTSYDGETWTNYSSKNGLPSGIHGNIIVDNKGNVWVGTDYGLAQYNGQSWRIYNRSEYWETTYNYLDEYVNYVSLAPDGTIWFYTIGLGLTNFDGYEWKNYTHPSLGYAYLSSITVAPNNEIWICGSDASKEYEKQLIVFSGEEWIVYEIPLTSWCFDVFVSQDGSIWVATEISLMKYEISR